jgi:hypothetical protein
MIGQSTKNSAGPVQLSPAAAAAMRKLIANFKKQATDQAEKISTLRAHVDSMALDVPGLAFAQYQLCWKIFGPPAACPVPPKDMPAALVDEYTMGGISTVEYNYLDATYPHNWPLVYTDAEIDHYLKRIAEKKWFVYGMVDVWVWQAIAKYPIAGLSVVNMGSLTPWYESNCIYHGATSTTIDYNKIITLTNRIKTMTVADWDRERPTFDMAWSISSFEHDGLGMYGDPLDPIGDIKAMQKMKLIVKPSGLMFFAVPVGKDKILFNNARIYGEARLKKMFEGWEVLDRIGLEPSHLTGPGHVQPVFVLKNV